MTKSNYDENQILILEFDSIEDMRKIMEKSATNYEGFIKNRIGYNFPSKFIVQNIPDFNKDLHKYVIAYIRGDLQVKKHELCHALFYLSEKYKKVWIKKWNLLNPNIKQKIEKKLKYMGYSDSFIIDEFQAYTQDGSRMFSNYFQNITDIVYI